jgi:hypothetical protein
MGMDWLLWQQNFPNVVQNNNGPANNVEHHMNFLFHPNLGFDLNNIPNGDDKLCLLFSLPLWTMKWIWS